MFSVYSLFSKRRLLPPTTAFVTLKDDHNFNKQYQEAVRAFKKSVGRKNAQLRELAHEVAAHYKISTSSADAVSFAYNREYAGIKPNYSYLSPILLEHGFEMIIGYDRNDASSLKILDVGAGSNEFLRFCHDEIKVPKDNLFGSDISQTSVDIIKRNGFGGYLGRLEQLPFPSSSFDLIYLSYFIDYDTDQAATFASAINLVRSDGKIVLEGWFPVRPFALLPSDKKSFSFITKGENKFEDTMLVFDYIKNVCAQQKYNVELERVCEGTRCVYSRYGFKKLPSWFLVFKIKK